MDGFLQLNPSDFKGCEFVSLTSDWQKNIKGKMLKGQGL